MGRPVTSTVDAVARFWNRYLELLVNQDVKENERVWYARRAEHYLAATKNKKLVRHDALDVEQYLRNLGRESRLAAWQFRQCVRAIQNLHRLVGSPAVGDVDWDHWAEAGRHLPGPV